VSKGTKYYFIAKEENKRVLLNSRGVFTIVLTATKLRDEPKANTFASPVSQWGAKN
jgi:hypothetical protein